MGSILSRLGRVVRVVIHDPEVDRAGRQLALLLAARITLAVTGSAAITEVVAQLIKTIVGG